MNNWACFKCGSQDHLLRDCPELVEKEKIQNTRSSNTAARGRPPRNTRNTSGKRSIMRDSTVSFEARAPARAYAICAREDASSPNVITSTFSLYDTNSTEFVTKVSNPLGKYAPVDKGCKNCPLMTWGYYFLADLMLFPFDEFDVILGMDWLTLHDAVSAQKCVRKGCEAYLAYVLDTKVSETKIESVPVVCEYLDVSPEELLGLPPIREVEFAIELVLGS
ncbi:ruBisCO large subunit-binding protein subunit alpha, chloroplastic-like [Gossypium australe]|uniref:RuBisCO large subunit-binding protein subunit alpha, chloroplastic-like n=1 Tax=Gossypium australe TaxID=47621 RepID=A0A5B6UY77_9ROSI|nr:ruBisCO large subunit-binding protein subunit alpha, chloroplastic-like [Gossypium australe]